MNTAAYNLAKAIRSADDREARGEITPEEALRLHYAISYKARLLGVYEEMRHLLRQIQALAA